VFVESASDRSNQIKSNQITDGLWWQCNDSNVRLVLELPAEVANQAYLLFYVCSAVSLQNRITDTRPINQQQML
jgi:hypothetical protein